MILKESCPKNVALKKTRTNTFLTFLDKMQIPATLCLATYDWFCEGCPGQWCSIPEF